MYKGKDNIWYKKYDLELAERLRLSEKLKRQEQRESIIADQMLRLSTNRIEQEEPLEAAEQLRPSLAEAKLPPVDNSFCIICERRNSSIDERAIKLEEENKHLR